MTDALHVSTAVAIIVVSLVTPRLLAYIHKRMSGSHQSTKEGYETEIVTDETSPIVTKEDDFPDDWWTSGKRLALEKRAIFSKVCSETSITDNY
jgi:hypothetical protein